VCVLRNADLKRVDDKRSAILEFDDVDFGAPALSRDTVTCPQGRSRCGEQSVDELPGACRSVYSQFAPRLELHAQTDDREHSGRVVEMQVTQKHGADRGQAQSGPGELCHGAVAGIDEVKLPVDQKCIGRLRAARLADGSAGSAEHDKFTGGAGVFSGDDCALLRNRTRSGEQENGDGPERPNHLARPARLRRRLPRDRGTD
jgi:hypothetical protein